MQLDRTEIVIRQRTFLESLDLSLIVFRRYWGPIIIWSILGMFPFMLINAIVTWSLLDYDRILLFNFYGADESSLRLRYAYHQSVLIFAEAPLALIGTTYILGRIMFLERPSFRTAWSVLKDRLVSCCVVLGIARGGLLVIPLIWFVPRDVAFAPSYEILLVGVFFLGFVVLTRAIRPFAPELLILEVTPIFGKKQAMGLSYAKRTGFLHSQLLGELVSRFMFSALVLPAFVLALVLAESLLLHSFFDLTWNWWCDALLFPLNVWMVATWATVYRFLIYIDSRIRLEGWELDLALRAEAARWVAA